MGYCPTASDLIVCAFVEPGRAGILTSDMKICLIGAGPSGLTAAKNFIQRGLTFDWYEQHADLGGLWNASTPHGRVYSSTHMISSKRLTEFLDFRMPRDFPQYPSHAQAMEYMRSYAEKFDLLHHIRFGARVEGLAPGNQQWRVIIAAEGKGKVARKYDALVVASGHHAQPRWPAWYRTFEGTCMHSSQYKSPEILQGKRVLVVGAGNSGCDIAVAAAQHATSAVLSMRRGYHVLPKFLFGAPIDRCGDTMHRWHVPLPLQRLILRASLHVSIGPLHRFGWPRPQHRILEAHPIINSQILHYVAHGRLQVHPDVHEVRRNEVRFNDGHSECFDLIICATGYQLSFPFIDGAIPDPEQPRLYLNVFHPELENLFVVGLIQPNGGIWQLADYQAQLIARVIEANQQSSAAADWFRNQKSRIDRVRQKYSLHYVDSPRHAIEVEYFAYRRELQRHLRQMDRRQQQRGRSQK